MLVDVKPEFSVVREEIRSGRRRGCRSMSTISIVTAANNSIYGSVAGIWTRDISKAHRTKSAS